MNINSLEDLYPTKYQCEELFKFRQKGSFAYWVRSCVGWHNELSLNEYDYIKVENHCGIYFQTNSKGEMVTCIPAPSVPEMELEYVELFLANRDKYNLKWSDPQRHLSGWGKNWENEPDPCFYLRDCERHDLTMAEAYAERLLIVYRNINENSGI